VEALVSKGGLIGGAEVLGLLGNRLKRHNESIWRGFEVFFDRKCWFFDRKWSLFDLIWAIFECFRAILAEIGLFCLILSYSDLKNPILNLF
jgi:hypothetical protein